MEQYISYMYRIYPNDKQKELMAKTFGCTRLVYNTILSLRIPLYNVCKMTFSFYEWRNFMVKCLKRKHDFLNEVDSVALVNSLMDQEQAIKNFIRDHNQYGYPKYKKKNETHLSYRTNLTNGNIKVDFQQNKVKLPKLGWLDAKLHREFTGKIKHATITKLSSDEYYVSICVLEDISFLPTVNKQVGLDLGIKTLCTTSDGVKYNYDFDFSFYENKIKKLQKYLSKKKQDSKRYRALQLKIAKIYQKITNKKEDTLHKIVSTLVNENQVICVEDLNVKRMMAKNKNKRKSKSKENVSSKNYLSKSIGRMSWYTFTKFIEDKCKLTGRTFQKIGKFYPSSQICSCCGYQNKKIKNLSIREWICPECNTSHDRDVNAAKNVLNEGLSLLEKSA